MLFVALGIGAGLALALAAHPLAVLINPIDALLAWLIDTGGNLLAGALSWTGLPADGVPAQVVSAALAVCLPGLVCLALASVARAAAGIRRAASAVLVIGALASFAILPAGQALVLVLLTFLLGAVLALGAGAVVVAPLLAAGTVLAVRTVTLILGGGSVELADGAAALAELSGWDAALWRIALGGLALAPIAAAARVALRSR